MKNTIAIVLMTLAVPATAHAWTDCFYEYDNKKDQAICERQNELERRIEESEEAQKKRLEELKMEQERKIRDAEMDAEIYASERDAYGR